MEFGCRLARECGTGTLRAFDMDRAGIFPFLSPYLVRGRLIVSTLQCYSGETTQHFAIILLPPYKSKEIYALSDAYL